MAGPTWGVAALLANATANTAQFAVPSGVVAGSVIVAVLYRDLSGASYEAVTLPSGFTLVPGNPGATTGTFHTVGMDIAWKRATGADSGTYDFSWTTSFFRMGVAMRLDGCTSSGNPFEADNGAVSSANSTSTPAVSVTTLGADRLLLWVGSSWESGAWTQPSGFTARVTNADFDLLTAASAAQAVAGASGSVAGTQVSEAHSAWVGAFLAGGAAAASPPQPGLLVSRLRPYFG